MTMTTGAGSMRSDVTATPGAQALFAAYCAVVFSVLATDLDIFLSVRGLLPINAIALFVAACGLLCVLLAPSGRLRPAADRFAVAVAANTVPIGLFLVWVALHVLLAGRSSISGPDVDFTQVFPIYQFLVLMFGFSLVAATDDDGQSLRIGMGLAIALLGLSVILETLRPGLLGASTARTGGIALNANVAAFILNALLAMFLDFRRMRGMDVVAMLFVALAVFSTLSRSGLAQFVLVAAAYYGVHGLRALARGRPGVLLGVLAAVSTVAVALVASVWLLGQTFSAAIPEFRERLEVLSFSGPAIYEDPYRFVLLEYYVHLALERPFLGFGTGYTLNTAVIDAPLGYGPHNMFVRAWVDHGLAGVTLYAGLLVSMLFSTLARRDAGGVVLLLLLIEYSFFAHNPVDTKATLMLAGIALARSALRTRGG